MAVAMMKLLLGYPTPLNCALALSDIMSLQASSTAPPQQRGAFLYIEAVQW
jgi:hypothetical protein